MSKTKSSRRAKKTKPGIKTVFKGYMQVPLDPNLSIEAMQSHVVFTEDWLIKRHEILKNPRRFKVTTHVFMEGVDKPSVTTLNYQSKGDKDTIVDVTDFGFKGAIAKLDDDEKALIEMHKSYVVVRA